MIDVNISSYLTVRQVAEKLDISEEGVRDLIQTKEIRATKIGKWRINHKDLEEFIKGRFNQ